MTPARKDYIKIGIMFLIGLFIFHQQYNTIECKRQLNELLKLQKFTFEDNVKFGVTYRAYACGKCSRLFRIDSVYSAENNPENFYMNKEIIVEKIDSILLEGNKNNIKYYVFSGRLSRNRFGVFKLETSH